MSTTNRDPARHPMGTPVGGRFATTGRQAPTTALVRDDLEQIATDPHADGSKLLALIRARSESSARRLGLDSDDVAGDTVVDIVAALRRHPDRVPDQPEQYVSRAVKYTAARHARERVSIGGSSVNGGAFNDYRSRCADLANELGRPLTPAEQDAVATQVRASRPPRRRPTLGFHRGVTVVGYGVLDDPDSGPQIGALRPSRSAEDDALATVDSVAPGGAAARILSADKVSAADRKLAWNAVAEVTGAPAVRPGTLPQKRASQAAELVREHGAVNLADAWNDGALTADDPAAAALFAPFGDLDDGGRDRAAGVIAGRNRAYGGPLWDAAMQLARSRAAG